MKVPFASPKKAARVVPIRLYGTVLVVGSGRAYNKALSV